jgi:hypothetical protein
MSSAVGISSLSAWEVLRLKTSEAAPQINEWYRMPRHRGWLPTFKASGAFSALVIFYIPARVVDWLAMLAQRALLRLSNERPHMVGKGSMTQAVKPACSVVLSLVTAAVLGASRPAVAHSSFDGTWNVLFVTEAGQCGPPFRYDISIVNGVVVTSAEAAHDMSGHVDLNGNVRVSIYRAAERAVGSGRLQNSSGAGIWKGVLSAHRCSGSWQAERR